MIYKSFIKKFLIVFTLVLLTGCATENNKDGYKLEQVNDDIYVFVDKETGVNYIVFYGYKAGGIVPRYNKDGSLYITKGE